MTTAQKIIIICAIVLAVLLVVGIIFGAVGFLVSLGIVRGTDDSEAETSTYSVNGTVERLDIEVGAADLEIVTGDTFSVESNSEDITVKESNRTLKISQTKRWRPYNTGCKITVCIPEGTVFEKADIELGAGKVTVSSLAAKALSLDLGAGNVEIDSLSATERADIDGGAGGLVIRGGELHNLNLDVGVGNIELTGRLCGNCEIDGGVGNIDIALQGNRDDYKIDIDKGLGNVTFDGEKAGDGDIFGSGENTVRADNGVGNMNIRFVG
ncbi:MAG: DUF4097 family beta strand repeat-containing protein [Eubacteriales bacterium]